MYFVSEPKQFNFSPKREVRTQGVRLSQEKFRCTREHNPAPPLMLKEQENISQMNTIFNMQMLLSSEKIRTVTLKLEEGFLPTDYIKSLRNIKQPMTVVFINCERDVIIMKNLSKELNRYAIITVVLFVKAFKSALIHTCMNPVGNPFLLSEGASFFVKCYEDIAIREWYALNENQMTIYERVIWEPARGLVVQSKKLMQSDNDVLNGKVLRIGRYSKSDKFDKYIDDLCFALKLAGNFTIKNVRTKENFGVGSWNKTSKSWTGSMGLIESHQVDILANEIPPDETLLKLVDLTIPLRKADTCLYIRKPSLKIELVWSGYFQPFTYKTWCALIVSLIVMVTLLTFLRLKVENSTYHGVISENFLQVWGFYCQQGLPEFPKASALQLFYYSTSLFGFLIFAIYSAAFVSELTILQEKLPFKSREEFLKDRSHKLATMGTLFYDNRFTDLLTVAMRNKLIKKSLSPKSEQEGFDLICSKNIVLLSTDLLVSRLSANTKIPCKLVKVHLQRPIYFSMALPKNSPYKKAINYCILKLMERGILKRIQSDFRERSGSEVSAVNAPTEQEFHPATIFDVASLLAMLCGSVGLSILILFFEKVYLTVRKKKSVKISARSRIRAMRYRKLN
ncbi:uncharacterized protein LOC117178431 [Belonocnema kinseyi]|uniref:uncharacterized protein LOC117178431 n=1 Tax=Belonocnema kinseyi TaxID=2817044 RepID=UPI00143DD286|nr:uncharacterized protein LOC117178431 [Belonocnema kinseyi]